MLPKNAAPPNRRHPKNAPSNAQKRPNLPQFRANVRYPAGANPYGRWPQHLTLAPILIPTHYGRHHRHLRRGKGNPLHLRPTLGCYACQPNISVHNGSPANGCAPTAHSFPPTCSARRALPETKGSPANARAPALRGINTPVPASFSMLRYDRGPGSLLRPLSDGRPKDLSQLIWI